MLFTGFGNVFRWWIPTSQLPDSKHPQLLQRILEHCPVPEPVDPFANRLSSSGTGKRLLLPRGRLLLPRGVNRDGNCGVEERCCTRFQSYLEKTYPESITRSCSGVIRRSFLNRIVLHLKGTMDEDRKFRWYVKKNGFKAHGCSRIESSWCTCCTREGR